VEVIDLFANKNRTIGLNYKQQGKRIISNSCYCFTHLSFSEQIENNLFYDKLSIISCCDLDISLV
jgi:hypothetical protein